MASSDQTTIRNLIADKVSREEKESFYKMWSKTYDKDNEVFGYNGPAAVAEEISKLFTSNRDQVRILDVGAGTGWVAEELKKFGFTNIDALEPSKDMSDLAVEKKLYVNIIPEYIGGNQLDITEDTYDAIVTSGCFSTGHVPCSALYEMIRLVRPGGYVAIAANGNFLVTLEELKDRFDPLVDQLEIDGKWKKVKNEEMKNYCFGDNGRIIVYEIC